MAGAPVGNQNAVRAKRWQQAIQRALARASNKDIDSGLDTAADKLVKLAMDGDKWALEELGDRIDGKPAQTIAGDPDAPLQVIQKVERVLKRADPAD
jgi:hypothetical protein